MKGLVRRILAPLIVAGALIATKPTSVSANDNFFSRLSESPFFSVGAGVYSGMEQPMRDIYGSMFRIKGNIGSNDEISNLRLKMNLAYARKKGQPYEFSFSTGEVKRNSRITIFEYGPLIEYIHRGNRVNFYAGGGLVEIFIKEELEEKIYFNDRVIERKGDEFDFAFGIIFSLGLEIPIDKEKKNFIYIESSGRYAMITDKFAQKKNTGGLALDAGIRRFIKIR